MGLLSQPATMARVRQFSCVACGLVLAVCLLLVISPQQVGAAPKPASGDVDTTFTNKVPGRPYPTCHLGMSYQVELDLFPKIAPYPPPPPPPPLPLFPETRGQSEIQVPVWSNTYRCHVQSQDHLCQFNTVQSSRKISMPMFGNLLT